MEEGILMAKNGTCDAHDLFVDDAKEFRAIQGREIRDLKNKVGTIDDRVTELEKEKKARDSVKARDDVELQKRDKGYEEKRDYYLRAGTIIIGLAGIIISIFSLLWR